MINPIIQYDRLAALGIKKPIVLSSGLDQNTDWSRWNCIYPNYIDSNKTMSQGRRIPKKNAVNDPTIEEMGKVCEFIKIPCVIEYNRSYSRDWMIIGRLRVKFLDDEGNLYMSNIFNKKQLMLLLAEKIPQLKSRQLQPKSTLYKSENKKKNKKKN